MPATKYVIKIDGKVEEHFRGKKSSCVALQRTLSLLPVLSHVTVLTSNVDRQEVSRVYFTDNGNSTSSEICAILPLPSSCCGTTP